VYYTYVYSSTMVRTRVLENSIVLE
jgi:hypothetical protein